MSVRIRIECQMARARTVDCEAPERIVVNLDNMRRMDAPVAAKTIGPHGLKMQPVRPSNDVWTDGVVRGWGGRRSAGGRVRHQRCNRRTTTTHARHGARQRSRLQGPMSRWNGATIN